MTLDELREAQQLMITSGRAFVRAWAHVHAPTLPPATLETILRAVGEISLEEAITAITREVLEPPQEGPDA